jgi:hypothetical protein
MAAAVVADHGEVGLPEPLLEDQNVAVQSPGNEGRQNLDIIVENHLEFFSVSRTTDFGCLHRVLVLSEFAPRKTI